MQGGPSMSCQDKLHILEAEASTHVGRSCDAGRHIPRTLYATSLAGLKPTSLHASCLAELEGHFPRAVL